MIEQGFQIDFRPEIDNTELKNVIKSYVGLIISSKISVDDVLLTKAQNLKFIGRLGSGMENVNVELAQKMGISCQNSPEGNRNAVAEHALGMLLSLMRNIHIAHQQMRGDLWLREDNRGVELDGKTIGIIGFGNTGQSFAQKLSGFNVNILANDIIEQKVVERGSIIKASKLDIFQEADIVSLHVPLNETTQSMVDQTFIEQLVKPIILINTSRGGVVNTKDLIKGLKTQKIHGAALDVFENEHQKTFTETDKKHMKFLLNHPQVICTPHVAGWTFEAREKMALHLYDKLAETWR